MAWDHTRFPATRQVGSIVGPFRTTTTTSGRLALLVVITTLVIGGPLVNVGINLRAMSSSLACGVELGRNQSTLMASCCAVH